MLTFCKKLKDPEHRRNALHRIDLEPEKQAFLTSKAAQLEKQVCKNSIGNCGKHDT